MAKILIAYNGFYSLLIDVRLVEKSQFEFLFQELTHRMVNTRFRDKIVCHKLNEKLRTRLAANDVASRLNRDSRPVRYRLVLDTPRRHGENTKICQYEPSNPNFS